MALSMTVLDWKLISTLIVSGGSMIFGLLPVYFGLGSRFQGSLLNSAFLCFGSGVLMSTSIVHILPETRPFLEGWAEIVFCSGFMIIFLIDIIFDLVKQLNTESESLRVISSYGSIGDESPDVQANVAGAPPTLNCSNFSLILAFSIHSLLEGLVIGVEPTARGVWILLLAICCHKLLVAFCLGCELSSDGDPVYKIIPPLFVFAVMSAAGIVLGCIIQPDEVYGLEKMVPTLQGLAGGTLLYIVMIEILPRELRKANVLPIFSSIVQYLAVLFGFALMTIVTTVTGD